jgi:hypothetical protein
MPGMILSRSQGGTFHYAGCGCTGQVPRLPSLVDAGVLKEDCTHRRLRVLYLVPHHNLTGGMKMLVQQMAILTQRGHHVIAAFRAAHGCVLPPWAESLVVASEMLISPSETYECFLRRTRRHWDVCAVGYFTQLAELDNFWGPLLYWEQGHEHLFAEGRDAQTLRWDLLFHHTMLRTPVALAAVSSYTAETLALQFSRRCPPPSTDACRSHAR